MKLGIDFGTTRTVVACADRGNYPVLGFLDEAGDSYDWFPSVVAERDGELRFGFAALAAAADPSFAAVRSFKRLLAESDAGPDRRIRLGTTTIGIGDLVTRFLRATREAVLTRSNLRDDLRRDDDIVSVVAVPANATGAQRFVTLDAFRNAGLGPIAMLNEPSAAGFEYTHRHRDTLSSRREAIVVYDLGGGTFDASLVRMRAKSHEVLATAGKNRLGGDDFDAVLVDLVLAKAGLARGAVSDDGIARIAEQCRDAKERLNPSSRKITVDLDDLAPEVTLTVADFYEACTPLVDESIAVMTPVMAHLERDGAGLDDLAGIYVVGGASELPIIGRALRQRFGRRVHRSPYPSAAIAIGLAIACDEAAAFELSDRYGRTFGVFREGEDGGAITFDPIFTHGTELPRRSGDALRHRRAYRAAHNVGHFRFVECNALAADGRPHGDMLLSGDVRFAFDARLREGDLAAVPVERLGDGPTIEEVYALDENGMVAITIKDLESGYERVYQLGATG